MRDFERIDWEQFNKPPFYQQWLCKDDTLKLATFGDRGLGEVDELVFLLKDQWDLDTAEGHFLDRIGKLLDVPRNGNTDEYYRLLLNLRRLLNTNDGSVPAIIKAIKYFYTSEIVHIVPDYPAGLIIEHDGEGTVGIDFNKLLAEIIPAGVSYSTKELFFFLENIYSDDSLCLTIHKDVEEIFGSTIKYNGSIKYDGHTLNCGGDAMAVYLPEPPFKYRPSVADNFEMRNQDGNTNEQVNIEESVFAGVRKHHFFDGTYKYNGTIKYDAMVLISIEE